MSGTPRSISFCGHAILAEDPLVVPDARHDPRFAGNPLVVERPHVRFYAGVPIHALDRRRIGTLCVVDYVPREFGPAELETLQDLARSTEELIQRRNLAISSSQLLSRLGGPGVCGSDSECWQDFEHLVTQDMLTGLPNRARLLSYVQRNARQWNARGTRPVLAVLDLDRFTDLNAALGHAAGDRALAGVAVALAGAVRGRGLPARIGGDQFAVLLDTFAPGETPAAVLQAIMATLRQPLRAGADEVVLSCSIGFARFPDDGTSGDTLLDAANAAKQLAKKSGRGCIQAFTPALLQPARQRITFEAELRRALERDELVLHFQPKASVRDGRITGFEGLVRWNHPQRGLVPPNEFIPLAEKSGLIVPLGEWVLRTACRQLQAWAQAGIAAPPVAVNLSSRQFLQDDLVAMIEQTLRATGLEPGSLELELTETASMADPEKSADVMRRLREIGVTLCIDDFGTGYSSLSYLKRLPIDKLKIDRSFIFDMTHSEESLAIVEAIIAMAHRLNLKVVAEGVETEEQLARLRASQCDEMQGYLLSRPVPAERCVALL